MDARRRLFSKHGPSIFLVLLSLGATVYLAAAGQSSRPPTVFGAVVLTVLAGTFQVLATTLTARHNRIDHGHVRSATKRLEKIAGKAVRGERVAETAYETGTPAQRREALGQVSVYFSMIREEIGDALGDWTYVSEEVIIDLLRIGNTVRNGPPTVPAVRTAATAAGSVPTTTEEA